MSVEKEQILCELLVLRCQRGETKAQEELVRLWEKRLFYFIRRLASDEEEAWDILQETWLKVLRALPSLREPRRLPVWLYRIARNTAMSRLRAQYAAQALREQMILQDDRTQKTFDFAEAVQVHAALDQLTLHHREVLTLFFLDDLSIEEIGVVLDVATGTVKSRLFYARQALRQVLEEEEVSHATY